MTFQLHHGDCLEVLRGMAENSVDSIVTDPPYGLSFMGKRWDYDVPSVEVWAECLRVLKPGGHLLAFAGTRTQHRMAVRIEDAGFEIRDMIAWVYGSGFPKSHNGEWGGTALKPALKPITMARKPLVGTVEQNWREHGTGALNIDVCRVGDEVVSTHSRGANGAFPKRPGETSAEESGRKQDQREGLDHSDRTGRWPANLIHDGSDEVMAAFPDAGGQQGPISSTAPSAKTSNVYGAMRREFEASANSENTGPVGFKMKPGARRLDTGSAARFFYCAKASRADRNEGVGSSSTPVVGAGATMREREDADWPARNGNHHPTVKPTALCRYLQRLVTPPGGTTLDLYMGSGSFGKSAILEGFNFIGIEREVDFLDIARARIEHAMQQPKQHSLDLEVA